MSQSRITNCSKLLNKTANIKTIKSQLALQQTKHRVLPRNGVEVASASDQSVGNWPILEQNLSQFEPIELRFGLPGNTGHPSLQEEYLENEKGLTEDDLGFDILTVLMDRASVRQQESFENVLKNDFSNTDERARMALADASSKLRRDADNFEQSYQQLDNEFGLTDRQKRYEQTLEDVLVIQAAFQNQTIDIATTSNKIPGLRSKLRKVFNEESCKFGKKEVEVNTVYTLAYQTENDMAAWTDESATERENKMRQFYRVASAFVNFLGCDRNVQGDQVRWADFIDPEDGKSFMNKKDDGAMIEATNKSYNEISELSVEDFGCCELLKHSRFGSHVFVGTIVSNGTGEEWFWSVLKNGINLESAEQLANWAVPKRLY